MIRKHLKVLILTSIVILLPILAGLLLWNQLPDRLPNHWNTAGEIDGWTSKSFGVFGMPMILLALQWVLAVVTATDPKKAHHTCKVLHLVFWIPPVLSLLLHATVYAAALGTEVRMETIMPVCIGLLFSIIGNYLPKCRQNYTIGIKLPWTLNSEENWNRTHRLAGRLWMVCGIVIMLTGFFGILWIMLSLLLLMVAVPLIYSYVLYRRGV